MTKNNRRLLTAAIAFPAGQFIWQYIRYAVDGLDPNWEQAISSSIAQVFVVIYLWSVKWGEE